MAIGDVVVFDQFLVNALDSDVGHDFGATPNVLKCAIVDSTITPATTTANPHWSATGTDLSANEVTAVGDYTAGGNTLATPSVDLVGGAAHITFGNPTAWATGTDPDARWAIIYDDTATNKPCIGFVDLGSAFDMSTGTLTVTFGSPPIAFNQA
jgi:hypothetical protein